MRKVEDIVRVKKEYLPESHSTAKKIVAPSRFKNERELVAHPRGEQASIRSRSALIFNFFNNKRLYFLTIAILFVFIIFGLFLSIGNKDTSTSIENISDELKKENELLEKEISELEEFNSGDSLENINRKIEEIAY